jgi:predicted component of type VI protein secretion system
MKAELVPDNGDPPIPITRDVTVIGRKDYCDVKIDHHSLSKRHCVVVKTDGLLIIRDLVTTNGTKVKGQKIRWAALLPDDRLTLGGYKVRVYLGPDDVSSPSERQGASGQTFRQVAPPAALLGGPPVPAARPSIGFAAPSQVGVPSADSGGLEILDDEGDDSGWRRLISYNPGNDEAIIELE